MNQGQDGDPPYTSEDLFGDLVDKKPGDAARAGRPDPTPAAPRREAQAGPIKIRVAEPSVIPKPEPPAEDLGSLVDAFDDGRGRPAAAPAPVSPPPASAGVPAEEVPTPVSVHPLPDLPELKESRRDAEAMTELLQLTSRLPSTSELTRPDVRTEPNTLAEGTSDGSSGDLAAIAPPAPAPEGIAYGPYRLIEKIAAGGMAEVFKAKRSGVAGFEKILAVKRILPHLSHNKEFVEMFIDEAKMVAGLQHPNIVQIFDLGRIGTSYYIAMEYVPGVDLRSILKKLRERGLRMPLDLAMFVVSRVAAGLHYAHQKKDAEGRPIRIVHRDVSPQNILISFDGEVKLTDFGIAKAASKASTTEKGALRGKLMYMSPEQAWARPIDHRSDVFALGIVLYELVTDQRPFLGGSDMSLLERVRRGTVAPPSSLAAEVPARLEKLVMKALEREAADRLRDAGAMQHELEALLKEPEHAMTPKDLERFVRILFERTERFGTPPEPAGQAAVAELEVDLDGLDEPAPDEPLRIMNDAMSAERLLRRFH